MCGSPVGWMPLKMRMVVLHSVARDGTRRIERDGLGCGDAWAARMLPPRSLRQAHQTRCCSAGVMALRVPAASAGSNGTPWGRNVTHSTPVGRGPFGQPEGQSLVEEKSHCWHRFARVSAALNGATTLI